METRALACAAAILAASASAVLAGDRFVAAFALGEIGDESRLETADIGVVEMFEGESRSFAVFEAPDQAALSDHLGRLGLPPQRLLAVNFVNSPEIGGGDPAGEKPLPGHAVYVIERPIPGVGSFPLEKKQMISRRSNASVRELGNAVEWDHSYLTSEGTFCIYRAVDEKAIMEHARLSGAPVKNITLTRGGDE
ncbi:MAG: nickel-binding protein [Pseudooceanicola sp.]